MERSEELKPLMPKAEFDLPVVSMEMSVSEPRKKVLRQGKGTVMEIGARPKAGQLF